MIKVSVISDLHGKESKIQHLLSGGDILFCTGDITPIINRTIFAVLSFLKWFNAQNYTYKIFIGGNNDNFLQRHEQYICALIAKKYSSVTYLNDEQIQITIRNRQISIFGTPHSINGTHRAFVLNTNDLQNRFKNCDNPDFILSHGPPLHVLDCDVGCPILQELINAQKPKFHLFGHIHEGHGRCKRGDTVFVNGSVLGAHHKVLGKLQTFIWGEDGSVEFE
ncbi:Calcineurin-like_phosphoesterase [Hexamita inflata]|uniref:Calcineurin-like_phosphoesterase n=1 Tax=Hexamita inflata TaxID=28002 RepID=A0ABP1HGG0_9EUKA